MNRKHLAIFIGIIIVFLVAVLLSKTDIFTEKSTVLVPETGTAESVTQTSDYKNISYEINGERVTLVDGLAETEQAPDSNSKVITRYFGNELVADLNSDGRDDVAFILSQETGGSGIFYYAVAAIKTDDGYVGTDGYLLGDRIAPQSTDISSNPRQVDVVVFNYLERASGEPMTTQPSVGRSVYLKLVPESMRWAIVEPDFAGESAVNLE